MYKSRGEPWNGVHTRLATAVSTTLIKENALWEISCDPPRFVFIGTAVYIVLGPVDDLGLMTILIVTNANLECVSFAHHIANTRLNRRYLFSQLLQTALVGSPSS